MEAQTDEKHYFNRKSKSITTQHIRLSDHKSTKKKTNHHQNKNLKKAKYYSSTKQENKENNTQPTNIDDSNQKPENIFTKIKHFLQKIDGRNTVFSLCQLHFINFDVAATNLDGSSCDII